MNAPSESPVGLVRGTRDALPDELWGLERLERSLLRCFEGSGYRRLRTPVLERSELHERKSGVGIVSKLDMTAQEGICLRPEFTAGIVRAFAFAPEPPPTPWRVCYSGPVFRRVEDGCGLLREFHQVGVELIGAPRPSADAEVIGLAEWALFQSTGIDDPTIRIGHVGLIREMLERSGLPAPVQVRLVERLSRAVNADEQERAVEEVLAQGRDEAEPAPGPSGGGAERLFASLYPNVVGRRSGDEIVSRLRRKWELGHTLADKVDNIKKHVHKLADLHGPAAEVLERLETDHATSAPGSVEALRGLIRSLELRNVDSSRVTLDLGFGRGIGFYSQMMFALVVDTPEGPIEVCGGGRYDGLTRELGGDRDDRGVGFAFGLERAADAARLRGRPLDSREATGFLVGIEGPDAAPAAWEWTGRAMNHHLGGVVFDPDTPPAELASTALRLGIRRALVFRSSGQCLLIDPRDGSKQDVDPNSMLGEGGAR